MQLLSKTMNKQSFAALVAAGACALSLGRASGTELKPPDYRLVVEDRQIIVQPKDLGLEEKASISPEGLTFAKNGDLLMATCSQELCKTFIMRSLDRGKTWQQQGVLEHKSCGGEVEGMFMTKSGRLVLIYYVLKQTIEDTGPGWPYYMPGGNNFRFTHLSSQQWGAYSDDEGTNWQYVAMDIHPFKSMDAEASSQIFEEEDGTLVASFRGHLNQEELDSQHCLPLFQSGRIR